MGLPDAFLSRTIGFVKEKMSSTLCEKESPIGDTYGKVGDEILPLNNQESS